jgi:hypothetical protein
VAIKGRNSDGSYTIKDIRTSPANCAPPVAKISSSSDCKGETFKLALASSTGTGPYSLTIKGTTYNNVAVGQTIATITSPLQKIWNNQPFT